MAGSGDISRELACDVASRRTLLHEFEITARAVLGDDADATGFAVTGAAVDLKTMAVRPRYAGVPAGARMHPEGYWTPDRPTMIELLARICHIRSRRWDPIDQVVADPDPGWVASFRTRWPRIFDCEMSCCGGWADLIEAVTAWLEERDELVPFVQIKEKFGEIRMYPDGRLGDFGNDLTTIAEHFLSGHICELCGAPGKTSNADYLMTLCDRHRREGQRS